MKEQDLIDLGFEKQIEENVEDPFYYYYWEPYKMSRIGLISQANDEVTNNFWNVYMFDDDDIVFSDIEDVKLFMDVIKRNIKQ